MITKNETKYEDNHQSFYHMKNGLLAKSKIYYMEYYYDIYKIYMNAFIFAM